MVCDKKFTYSCKYSDVPTCLPEIIIEPNEGRSVSNATSVPRRPVSLLSDHLTTSARISTLQNTLPLKKEWAVK